MVTPSRERGQLLLVAGLVIALIIFGVVVLLNSMLFVSNVAPHQATTNIEDGSAYRAVVADDVGRIVNESAAGEEYIVPSALDENVSSYSARMGEVAAETGPAYFDIEVNGTASETMPLLIQDSSGHFESKRDGKEWTVFDDGRVEAFEMTVAPNSYSASEPQPFAIRVDDGDDEWTLTIFADGNRPVVETRRGGTPPNRCDGFDKKVGLTINRTHVVGSNGNTCSISFTSGLDSSYSFEVDRGEKIETEYRILVDGDVERAHTDGAGSPRRVDAITSAAFDVTYDTPQISYGTTITGVRPNGASTASIPPHAKFRPDENKPSVGDAVTFDASASSDSDGTISEYIWTFGDGTEARGKTVTKAFTEPGAYDVQLTVKDNDGETTTATKRVLPYLALNAGGSDLTSGPNEYMRDDGYASGGSEYSTGDDIEGLSGGNVYLTERYGKDFEHTIAVPDGEYVVTLQFAEIYWGKDGRSGPNQRVFDVQVEGTTMLDDLDIYQRAGGEDRVYKKQIPVQVTDGELTIRYDAGKNNAKISGVIIRPKVVS